MFLLVSELWVRKEKILSKLEQNLKRIGQWGRREVQEGIVLVD